MTQAQVFLGNGKKRRNATPLHGAPFTLRLGGELSQLELELAKQEVVITPEARSVFYRIGFKKTTVDATFFVGPVSALGLPRGGQMSEVKFAGFNTCDYCICAPEAALRYATQYSRSIPGGRVLVMQPLLDCPYNRSRYIFAVSENAAGVRTVRTVIGSPRVWVGQDVQVMFQAR